ncbi:MAG: NAD(P)H-dependent glycerol-3-phosphate dehydrogenase [Selenomonadaceae bacterium]|nr:NAD(P)H-dependent glycerol-3-phosphate dehydrogenase [Selenomonadaceae bacterium]
MRVGIIGCGRWGSFHAWYASRIGHDVMLYGRASSANMQRLEVTRGNEYLKLPDNVRLTKNLEDILNFSEVIIISVGSQNLRGLVKEIKFKTNNILDGKIFVLCMKGLERGTGKRLTEVFVEENKSAREKIAVWVGPGHVQDFLREIPNCMVMSSTNENLTRQLVEIFKSPLIRFYYGKDLLGTEIGAAAKNVIGIAAGMLDGLNYSSLKGALMARGTAELSRLVGALGGDKMTVYGLSHLGDYEATLFSAHSHNRKFGEDFVQHKTFDKLAEGVETVAALIQLAKSVNVELPISESVYKILYENANPKEELTKLFLRSTKEE